MFRFVFDHPIPIHPCHPSPSHSILLTHIITIALALRNIRWTVAAAAAAAASSSPFWQRRGLLLVAATGQQEEQGNGSSRDNAVRSLFTDARERRRQQEEAAEAQKAGGWCAWFMYDLESGSAVAIKPHYSHTYTYS